MHYIHGLASYSLNLSSGSILVLSQAIPEAKDIFLAGVGLGEHLLPTDRTRPPDAVWHIWDDDACMWRETLSRFDFRVHLFSGRIKPYLGVDLIRSKEILQVSPLLDIPCWNTFTNCILNICAHTMALSDACFVTESFRQRCCGDAQEFGIYNLPLGDGSVESRRSSALHGRV